MTCPKCRSDYVQIQVVNEQQLKNAHHGILWWIFIGFWWVPIKWLFLTVPALLAMLFIPKKQKIKNKTVKKAVCQNCSYVWSI